MRILVLLAVLGLSFASATATSAGFVDPLDVSAALEPQLAHAPMTAITQAGNRLIAVGQRGVIAYSDDSGVSWHQAHDPVSIDLTAVTFSDPQQGWAVGHDGIILHSHDGGRTWQKQLDGTQASAQAVDFFQKRVGAGDQRARPYLDDARAHQKDNASNPFLSVLFLDAQEGFAVGSFGLLMHTTDGGQHWSPFNDHIDNPDGLHLFGLCSDGGNLYIASEKGSVFVKGKSEDHFVRTAANYKGSFFGVVCAPNHTVLAYGLRGTAFKSSDAGLTWSQVDSATGATLTAGSVLGSGRVALVDLAGTVVQSDQTVSRFVRIPGVHTNMLAGISPSAGQDIVVVGTAGAQIIKAH